MPGRCSVRGAQVNVGEGREALMEKRPLARARRQTALGSIRRIEVCGLPSSTEFNSPMTAFQF